MKDKVWEVDYQGSNLSVTNKLSWLPPKTSELLEINGKVVKHIKGSFLRPTSTIKAAHEFNGVKRKVEVRIAQKNGAVGTGAQIYVDGEFIGGDDSIQYPDPKLALESYQKGYFNYLLKVGLLQYGLPFAVIMTIINRSDTIEGTIAAFLIQALFFGGAMSYFSWRGIVSRFKNHEL